VTRSGAEPLISVEQCVAERALTWPDLKEKYQEGSILGRLCELGSFPTIGFACAVEA
jgi:hypothetical protein